MLFSEFSATGGVLTVPCPGNIETSDLLHSLAFPILTIGLDVALNPSGAGLDLVLPLIRPLTPQFEGALGIDIVGPDHPPPSK